MCQFCRSGNTSRRTSHDKLAGRSARFVNVSLCVPGAGHNGHIDNADIEVQNWLKLLHFPANFPRRARPIFKTRDSAFWLHYFRAEYSSISFMANSLTKIFA